MIVLWLWLAGVVIAWRPVARWFIRDVTDDGRYPADIEDVTMAAVLGLLTSAGWPLLLAWLAARPFLVRAADRFNATRDGDRS